MKKSKIIYLEGIRGIASLIVVLNHLALAFYPYLIYGYGYKIRIYSSLENIIYATPLGLLFDGNFAVCIFFVLSGYVLSNKYITTGKFIYIRDLALRRYFRLMIPVVCSTLLVYLVIQFKIYSYGNILRFMQLSGPSIWLSEFWRITPNFFNSLYEGLFGVFVLGGGFPQYNFVLWTMYYEFMGSFFVFAFLAFFGRIPKRWILYILFILMFLSTYFEGFILGVMLCDLKKNNKLYLDNFKILPMVLLALALYLGSFPVSGTEGTIYNGLNSLPFIQFPNYQNYIFYHTVGAFLLIYCALSLKWLQDILTNKVSAFLGKISFSLYLTHVIVIYCFSVSFFILLHKNLEHMSYNQLAIITTTVSLILIFAFAYIFTKFVDEKGIDMSSKIALFLLRKNTKKQ